MDDTWKWSRPEYTLKIYKTLHEESFEVVPCVVYFCSSHLKISHGSFYWNKCVVIGPGLAGVESWPRNAFSSVLIIVRSVEKTTTVNRIIETKHFCHRSNSTNCNRITQASYQHTILVGTFDENQNQAHAHGFSTAALTPSSSDLKTRYPTVKPTAIAMKTPPLKDIAASIISK